MTRLAAAAVAVVGLLAVAPARAEEAKAEISASLLIDLLRPPVASRDVAYGLSGRDAEPARKSPYEGEVQPDGSVKYGNVTVTVKNPCPPGTDHYEPPPLPGRRSR